MCLGDEDAKRVKKRTTFCKLGCSAKRIDRSHEARGWSSAGEMMGLPSTTHGNMRNNSLWVYLAMHGLG